MMPTLWKKRSSQRSDLKIGGAVFGVFLLLGLGVGLGIGSVAARQSTKQILGRTAEYLAESAGVVGRIVAERRRALQLLATSSALDGIGIGRFRRLYPEFDSVTVGAVVPRPADSTIVLSVSLPKGQRLVGSLGKEWATRLLARATRVRGSRVVQTTVLVGSSGTLSEAAATPPSLRELRNLGSKRLSSVRWSDGKGYATVLQPLQTSDAVHGQLTLVSGVRTSALAAQESRIRRAGLLLGLIVGAVPGALALVGISRSTRRLRAKNRTLEERVSRRTAELASAESSLREMFENVPLGLYQCDERGRFLRVNPALAEMFGCANAEVAAEFLESLDRIGHPAERAEFIAKLKTAGRAETMVALPSSHGRCVWLRETAHAVYGLDGRLQGFDGVVSDVTEQLALESQLRQIGATDPLTGLLNRRGFQEAIEKAELPATVVVLDVDRFKEFNDTYGHPAGDRALRTVAEAMRAVVRERGVLARTGGEEFALFLPGTGLEAGLGIAEEVRNAVEECAIRENMLTVSGGVATVSGLSDVQEAFESADRALYAAKQGGRNRIVASATSLL